MNLDKTIEQIADSLGVAVEKIYPALYKQAMITGIMDIVWIVIFLSATLACVQGIRHVIKKQKEENEDRNRWRSDWDWDEPRQVILIFVSVVVILISLIAIPVNVHEAITVFFNTDYHIVSDILNKVKG